MLKNQKAKKPKKILSGVLASTMLATSVISGNVFTVSAIDKEVDNKVFSMKNELLCSWGTSTFGEKSSVTPGKDKTDQKIYLGTNPETGKPQEWWIAGRTFTNGDLSSDPSDSSHMMLYTVNSIGSLNFDNSEKEKKFSDFSEKEKEEFKYLSKNSSVNPSHYGMSEIRKKLKTFGSGSSLLKRADKKLLKDNIFETLDVKNNVSYQLSDKFFLPSGNSEFGVVSWDKKDISSVKKINDIDIKTVIPNDYWSKNTVGGDGFFWLRSANAGFALPEKMVKTPLIDNVFNMSPLCKISLESVIFASTASAFNNISNGKFSKVEKTDGHYGMYLKSSTNGTDLVDGTIKINEKNPSKIIYENAPKDTYLTACITEETDKNLSYVVSIPVNETGDKESGEVDLKNLDTSNIEPGKKFNVRVWLEKEDKKGVVATMPKSTTMITEATLSTSGISPMVFDGKEKTVSDLVVKIGDKSLVKDKDYKVEYENNKEIGMASLTILGMGEYSGKILVRNFEILKPTPILTLKDKTIVFDGKSQMIDEAIVSGLGGENRTKSNVIYTYYKDPECEKKLCAYCPVISKKKIPKAMPKQPGEYYVKARLKECKKYMFGESNIAKLTIK